MFKRMIILFAIELCCLQMHAQGSSIGTLNKLIDEASGITIASTPGVFAYVLNDSGDTSRFFGIDDKGRLIHTFYFKGVEGNKGVRDCEDMASGKGIQGNERYIYIGDIGDNGASRPYVTIYRTPEPAHTVDTVSNVNAEPVFFTYPDGPRDAEAMMVDNIDRLLYIISKREDTIGIYTASLQWNTGDT
ncbi:MAG TPA: hypothetical protein VFV68_09390, partial [Agriterribacter sp.]|nr:hypothetical protein [Agriterribacter sp.]